jgi:hypothetical protein
MRNLPHWQPIPKAVVDGSGGKCLLGQAQGHLQRVGAVVVVGDGELGELVDQQPRAWAVRLETQAMRGQVGAEPQPAETARSSNPEPTATAGFFDVEPSGTVQGFTFSRPVAPKSLSLAETG